MHAAKIRREMKNHNPIPRVPQRDSWKEDKILKFQLNFIEEKICHLAPWATKGPQPILASAAVPLSGPRTALVIFNELLTQDTNASWL